MENKSHLVRDILLTILIPLFLLACAEAALRIAGIHPTPDRRESIINYQWVKTPLTQSFEYYEDFWELHKQLTSPKEDEYRIFCFGGSATQGWKIPEKAFPQQLDRIFRERGQNDVKVYNFGAIGWSSLQVLTAVQTTIRYYQPDLIFIYSGNNELHEIEAMKLTMTPEQVGSRMRMIRLRNFLEKFHLVLGLEQFIKKVRGPVQRTAQNPDEEIRLDVWPVHNTADRKFAKGLYKHHLEEIASICKAKNIPLVIGTIAVSLHLLLDKQEHEEDTARLLKETHELAHNWKHDEALELLKTIQAPDAQAQVHWLYGWIALRNKEYDKAETEFRKSADLAVPPIRAQSWVNPTIRSIAKRYDIPVLDVETLINEYNEENICCSFGEPISDHVHFTEKGHRMIADALFELLTKRGMIPQ